MKKVYGKEKGDIGIATLILFIAIIIVAAIASSLIIYVGITLREQGEKVASDAVSQITSSINILNILGDRDIDGKDPSVIGVKAPIQIDRDPPQNGLILNVTVNSANPLSVKIVWNSAVDTGTGMAKEEIYRVEGDYTSLSYVLQDMNFVKSTGKLIAIQTSNFTDHREFIDYTVESNKIYGYAIIGYDFAGNPALYMAVNQTVSTGTGTPDTTPPSGNVNSIDTAGYGVMISWTADDSGSGIAYQKIYRSNETITSSNINTSTLVATVNGNVRNYIDYPSKPGIWYYAVVGYDRAGNSAIYSSSSDHISVETVDTTPPSSVVGLTGITEQYSLHLEWKKVVDNESGIKGYYIYRSLNYINLATPEMFNRKPYGFTTNTSFDDYHYMPYQMYYYAVIPVNNASLYGEPVVPQSSIQILQIKLSLGPGSQPIDFNTVIVELTDGKIDASLKLNSSGFGIKAADSTHYGVEVINDPTGEFMESYILDEGTIIKMYINARAIGLTLTPQTKLVMKILPRSGVPIYKIINIPSIMLNRYVEIY